MVGDTYEYYEVQTPYFAGQSEHWSKYCTFAITCLEEAKEYARELASNGARVRVVRVESFVEFEVM